MRTIFFLQYNKKQFAVRKLLSFHKKMENSVDAVIRPIVLIPQNLAGGFHGLSIELPNEKACYQL
jgi:hypothetical protein